MIRSIETFTYRILQIFSLRISGFKTSKKKNIIIFIRIQKFRNRSYQENNNISKGMVQKRIQSLVKQLRSFLAENK